MYYDRAIIDHFTDGSFSFTDLARALQNFGQFSNARIYTRQFILRTLKESDDFQLLFMIQDFKQIGSLHYQHNRFYDRIDGIENFNA